MILTSNEEYHLLRSTISFRVHLLHVLYDYVHLDNLSDISASKCCETTTYTVTFTDFYHEQ